MSELRKPTMRDVARLAGVSEQTVSNVLNKRPHVSDATRERVEEAAERLNYRINRLARSLKTSRSTLVAVIVPSVTNPIYAEVADVIGRQAARLGYSMMLANSDRDPETEARLVETALDHQVAGLLLASIDPMGRTGRRVGGLGVPCVQMLNRDPFWTGDYFGANNVRGAHDAVANLIARGHRVIGHLRGRASFVAEERLRGYTEALVAAGLEADPGLVAAGRFSREDAALASAALIEARPDMTAIFCASDLMAYGALDELARRGLSVPRDMAVVGFDDTAFSSLDGVGLSTVRFDVDVLAERAVARLVDRIEGRVDLAADPVFDIRPCSLIHRRTTDIVLAGGEQTP